MFRILIADDNPSDVQLLKSVMQESFSRPHEVYVTEDGTDALDFLHCRGPYHDAPRPNLILLDINMPRLGGLEVLSDIKADNELAVIPVIVLSSSNHPEDVRRAYKAHANCYVTKPTTLERSHRFIQAVEAFWMDVAVLPSCDDDRTKAIHLVGSD